MDEVTERQEELLDFLFRFTRKRGWPPTLDDAATHFQRDKSSIRERRDALVKKGYVKYIPRVCRTMEVRKLTPRLVKRYQEEGLL